MNRDQHDELNELGLTPTERDAFERKLAEFQQESQQRGEQPDLFWAAQKTRVMANLRDRKKVRGMGLIATAVAATALIVFMAVPSRVHAPGNLTTQQASNHAPSNVAAQSVDDEELLQSIHDTTSSNVPDALAPATILASEMDRGLEGASKQTTGRNNQ